MENIIWEKKKRIDKKLNEERIKIIQGVRSEGEKSFMEKTVIIGFNADQFFIRFPREFSEYLSFNQKEAKNKKYKFKIILDVSEYSKEDDHVKGIFEVIKNE